MKMKMPKRLQSIVAKASVGMASAAAVVMASPAVALATTAASSSGASNFTGVVDSTKNTLSTNIAYLGQGILFIVGAVALVSAAVVIVPAVFAHEKVEFNNKIRGLLFVGIACILAALSPLLITAVAGLVNSGVDLGTSNIVK